MEHFTFKTYLSYKFLNSLFGSASLGTIFTIYAILPPKTFSIGGITLALGAWILTFFYTQLLKTKPYKIILLMIEILPFCYLAAYLLFPNTFYGAILIYALYQIGFIFGDYLSRNETLIFHAKDYLSKIDKARQIGYLSGLSLAFIFYFILEKFGIDSKEAQIYNIHFLLLLLQCLVILTLILSFKGKSCKT
ncbi:hypothetical protein [Helicobacter pullorum]|uniref:hypothetical protein n=1 Tax=Helicobacter pullorum TaxID=35818 RepID=UPI00255C9AC3|nr:hypothetical protein [Helicobacter pullorum]